MPREEGPGEAAERATRRKWMTLLVTCLVLGGISGALIAITTDAGPGAPDGPVPLWAAALLSIVWLATMGYGAWYYETKVDELERTANYFGYAVGGGLVLVLYPVWYVFWWAGVVREPTHEAIVGLLIVTATIGYLWKKYR